MCVCVCVCECVCVCVYVCVRVSGGGGGNGDINKLHLDNPPWLDYTQDLHCHIFQTNAATCTNMYKHVHTYMYVDMHLHNLFYI